MADLGSLTSNKIDLNLLQVDVVDERVYVGNRLAGVTKLNGIPAKMMIQVLSKHNKPLLTYISDNNGLFDVMGVVEGTSKISIIAYDILNIYNATIQVDIDPI